ncbi:MAG: DevR family CRISPR-associated autoregulator [Acetobacteraceae bacterium]|nr:DevR family CRISPR-associated autoregulator [Acetobacteraceae bacterium]
MSTGNGEVFEIGIMARVTWNLHSLNNEGTVGNVIEPRTVVLASGQKTDGVSGEMLKHLHAQAVWLLEQDAGALCAACRKLDPRKAEENPELKGVKEPAEAVGLAIRCALCDLHGFLRTAPPVSRNSTVEFGWALGLPERTYRSLHLHARHSLESRTKQEREEKPAQRGQAAEGEGAEGQEQPPTGQMLYHRPTRSGEYAVVSVFSPWRIGLNEVGYRYVIDEEARRHRYQLALGAYRAMFMHTDGAMTSTRLPHVEAMRGVVAVSGRQFPVPLLSPMAEDYGDKLQRLQAQEPGLTVAGFDGLDQFCEVLNGLAERRPWVLDKAGVK